MHKKAEQNHQLHDYLVLLQTLQSLEVYRAFCYQLYLFLTYTNHYQNGILDKVIGSEGKVHYAINELNAFGGISDAKYANRVRTVTEYDTAGYIESILTGQNNYSVSGNVQNLRYSYDTLGNVKTRNDYSIAGKHIRDSYEYDIMNRLTGISVDSTVDGVYAKETIYDYHDNGNIKSMLAYQDNDKLHAHSSSLGNYQYNYNKPHALSHAGTRRYYYDDVGNMTTRNGDTITYNPLNKPATMQKSGASTNQIVHFTYGAGNARYLKTVGGSNTYYLGKAYEEQVEGNERKQTVYIQLGGKTIGTHIVEIDDDYSINPSNPFYKSTYNNYFHTDALGSITAITNDSGVVVERRSYEAFGKIRAMDYGTNDNSIANQVINTDRAFTGHEQISELSGLIHMNARVYDSDIGRFLSADTIIQDPHDSQAYNRYSYARNNPMVFTDPSGHSWWSKNWSTIKQVLIGVVVAILVVYTGGLILGLMGTTLATASLAQLVVSGAIAGFAGGFATGMLYGGNFNDSITMGAKGALYGGIGAGVASVIGSAWGASTSIGARAGRALMHGMSRAAISKAQGGKWSAGFWSGFATSALAPLASSASTFEGKVAMSAIVGGTASELGGGKFANGAVTGAFVHMYNDMAHPNPAEQRQIARMMKYNNGALEDNSDIFILGGIIKFFRAGIEMVFGNNVRVALLGNRTGHPVGKYPHYHRRGVLNKRGQVPRGQSINRHRPFEKSPEDKSFWDRF